MLTTVASSHAALLSSKTRSPYTSIPVGDSLLRGIQQHYPHALVPHYNHPNFSGAVCGVSTQRRIQLRARIVDMHPHLDDNATFVELRAGVLRDMVRCIDDIYFEGAVARLLETSRSFLHLRVLADCDEMPTAAGCYSALYGHHFLTISAPMILQSHHHHHHHHDGDEKDRNRSSMEVACGVACPTRLDVLLRILEHELCHFFVNINWFQVPGLQAHGVEFEALAFLLFGHRAAFHQLRVPDNVVAALTKQYGSMQEALRQRSCDASLHMIVPTGIATTACTLRYSDAAHDEPELENCKSMQLTLARPIPVEVVLRHGELMPHDWLTDCHAAAGAASLSVFDMQQQQHHEAQQQQHQAQQHSDARTSFVFTANSDAIMDVDDDDRLTVVAPVEEEDAEDNVVSMFFA